MSSQKLQLKERNGDLLCPHCYSGQHDADCNLRECQCGECPDDGGECERCRGYYRGSIALSEHEERGRCRIRTEDEAPARTPANMAAANRRELQRALRIAFRF
jgi:hypothetical protein